MARALITGITGQDGSYLAELLLDRGYEVHGIVRKEALEDPVHRMWRLHGVLDRLTLHPLSLGSEGALSRLVADLQPDECYHLAAQSFVSYAFDEDMASLGTNINSTHYLLSALNRKAPDCRMYFAGSSEMFGLAESSPQDEHTPFRPRSPYGISKLAGYHLARNYREQYGLFAACGILFNHESPRRGYEFVTRKITAGVARIQAGLETSLRLGNLDARRDWGHARDYVGAMWAMLQQDRADDFVIGTGRLHSVRELLEIAFRAAGLHYQDHVVIDERLFRPSEPVPLCAHPAKARTVLGWEPRTTFEALVEEMVEADIRSLRLHSGQDPA